MSQTVARWQTDQICVLLSARERRQVLQCLADTEIADTEELARAVRNGDTTEPIDEIVMRLHHVHLPKLADAGAVTFDPDDATISLTRDGRRLLRRGNDLV